MPPPCREPACRALVSERWGGGVGRGVPLASVLRASYATTGASRFLAAGAISLRSMIANASPVSLAGSLPIC